MLKHNLTKSMRKVEVHLELEKRVSFYSIRQEHHSAIDRVVAIFYTPLLLPPQLLLNAT